MLGVDDPPELRRPHDVEYDHVHAIFIGTAAIPRRRTWLGRRPIWLRLVIVIVASIVSALFQTWLHIVHPSWQSVWAGLLAGAALGPWLAGR